MFTYGASGSGADALEAAIAAVSKYGGASAGYRTLLDALIPAASILKEVIFYYLCMPFIINLALNLLTDILIFIIRG